jgi:hypothetical protein
MRQNWGGCLMLEWERGGVVDSLHTAHWTQNPGMHVTEVR